MKRLKFIISGGGTGGHIFPAIAIANEIRRKYPDSQILFIGAEDRMEMEKIPAAGYKVIGLPVAGFDRKKLWRNFGVLLKLNKSLKLAQKTIKEFQPDMVIGVGGYASGPTLKKANELKIPTLLQEQNSYAGVTNKLLAEKASKICVAYEGMEKFFPKEKIVLTGNPVRQDLVVSPEKQKEAYDYFKLNPAKKTILILGGSLGARTINQSIVDSLQTIAKQEDIQFLWQSGKQYFPDSQKALANYPNAPVHLSEFIFRMDLAYSVADLIISRAGAGSISEFCILGKPVILIPSPNVAEDHQTKNAMALVKKEAARIIPDVQASEKLIPEVLSLIKDEEALKKLESNIRKMALPDAAGKIVEEIEKIIAGK